MNLLYLLDKADNIVEGLGTPDSGFCDQTQAIWSVVGGVLMVARIVFPILVIIYGIIDVGKSVTSNKPEEISKSFKSLAFRLGAALAIFFVPAIVSFGISLANGFSDVEKDYKICAACIENPKGTTCKAHNKDTIGDDSNS